MIVLIPVVCLHLLLPVLCECSYKCLQRDGRSIAQTGHAMGMFVLSRLACVDGRFVVYGRPNVAREVYRDRARMREAMQV